MSGRIIRENPKFMLTRVGQIKIGEKYVSKSGKEATRSLDYFIATGQYKSLFEKAYGDKPNCIEILFVSDDPAVSCYERLELRKGSRLYARGDGQEFEVWENDTNVSRIYQVMREQDTEFLNKLPGKCYNNCTSYDRCKYKPNCQSEFEEVLTLNFMLPKTKIRGFWTLTTKGKESSIPTIVTQFDLLKELNGTIKGRVYDLQVEMVKKQTAGSKSVFPVLKFVESEKMNLLKDFTQNQITETIEDKTQDKATELMNKVSAANKLKELETLGFEIKEEADRNNINKEEVDKIRALYKIKFKTLEEVSNG